MGPTRGAKDDNGHGPRSAWGRFWFLPTDPTMLGFMRIVTGLLVIYVHLAYCFDLTNFFSANAYWPIDRANLERKEYPVVVEPLSFTPGDSWQEFQPNIRIPESLHRRAAVLAFLRALPDSDADRRAVLRYVTDDVPADPKGVPQAMDFLRAVAQALPANKEVWREEVLELFVPQAVPGAANELHKPPEFMRKLSPEERDRLADGMVALIRVLPEDDDGTALSYVTTWLADMSLEERSRALESYVFRLPVDRVARMKALDYLNTWGVDENQVYAKGRWLFSLWFHITDPTGLWVAHICILFIFVLFTLGIWSDVTSVLTWLAAVSYLHRTQQVLFGMDQMMNILLFYLMIGGCGAALSVDRLRARYRAARAIARAGGKPVHWAEAVLAGAARSWRANFAIRLIQVHFCFIYMSAGLSKLKGTTWWDHSAPWMTITNPEFSPIHMRWYEWLVRQLAEHRPVISLVCSALVFFTLALEISLPFLVWTRLRPYVVMGAVLLHAGITSFMGLTLFGLLMMTLLLAYMPAAVIRERVCWRRGSGPRLTVRFNGRDEGQVRAAAVIRAFDVADQVEWHDAAGPLRLTVEGSGRYSGQSLFSGALRSLVLLRAVAFLRFVPGFSIVRRRLLREGRPVAAARAKAPTIAFRWLGRRGPR
jgi:hypothetical protein